MNVIATTRIEVTDNVGGHLVTIERTVRLTPSDSKSRFIENVIAKAQGNTEEAVVTAAIGLDRKAASAFVGSTPEGQTP